MILLWGLEEDPPMALVRASLERLGVATLFLNQAEILDHEIQVEYRPDPRGTLTVGPDRYPLDEFAGMYLRPYDFRDFPDFANAPPDSESHRHAIRFEDILWGLADLTPALVINRPSSMQSNGSKPHQCDLIRRHGFATPPTLLTTEPGAVGELAAHWSRVIYKSISGHRSVVQQLADLGDPRLDDVRWCPTQFQEWIPGVDYRVHVVGHEAFAARIESDAIDYRYRAARVGRAELPEVVARRCVALTASLGLSLSGIDLRRTPGGEWYCFEVNPSPAFSCYEQSAPHSIADAVARLLLSQIEVKGGNARAAAAFPG